MPTNSVSLSTIERRGIEAGSATCVVEFGFPSLCMARKRFPGVGQAAFLQWSGAGDGRKLGDAQIGASIRNQRQVLGGCLALHRAHGWGSGCALLDGPSGQAP